MPRNNYKKTAKKIAGNKRWKTYGKASGQLFHDVMYLKSVINSELHNIITFSSGNVDDNGKMISLANVPQDDSVNGRTGTSLLPRYLSINATFEAGQADYSTFRLMIFRYWGESTDTAPSVQITDILSTSQPLSFLNDNNIGSRGDRERRIEVHKSKIVSLQNQDKGSNTTRVYKFNIEVNGPRKETKDHIKYRSGSTEQPVSGGFYILILSDTDSSDETSKKIKYTINSKLNFYDN